MSDDIKAYPERSPIDGVQGAVQVVVNGVPLVGGGVAEFIGQVFTPSVERRRSAWHNALADLV